MIRIKTNKSYKEFKEIFENKLFENKQGKCVSKNSPENIESWLILKFNNSDDYYITHEDSKTNKYKNKAYFTWKESEDKDYTVEFNFNLYPKNYDKNNSLETDEWFEAAYKGMLTQMLIHHFKDIITGNMIVKPKKITFRMLAPKK